MASFIHVLLDTAAPGGVTLDIGSGTVSNPVRTAAIATTDGDPTGYQMLIYGDVDESYNANIQADEGDSTWIAYSTSQSIKVSSGDGSKTVRIKIRDRVGNASTEQTDSVTLSTAIPSIDITVGPDVDEISKVAGFRTVSFTFQTDRALQAYKVKVVSSEASIDTAGTLIPTTNGSTNTSGSSVAEDGTVNVQVDGRDLEAASAGDGDKIIKVFGQDATNDLWST